RELPPPRVRAAERLRHHRYHRASAPRTKKPISQISANTTARMNSHLTTKPSPTNSRRRISASMRDRFPGRSRGKRSDGLRTLVCAHRAVRVARLAFIALVLALAACGGSSNKSEHHAAPKPQPAPPSTAVPQPPPAPPPPAPPAVPMSWESAGAF